MPRIPTSKPEDVRSKPSVGGQVNINSQDSFFRSIASASAEAGQLVEQAKIEKQKAIDAKEANQVKIFQDERAAELEARLRDADISEHSAIIDGFAAQTKRLSFNPGVSKATREALQQDHNLWTQRLYSNSMSWSAQKAEQDKMATAEQVIANSVNSMDVDGAYAAIESLNISPELKQARKNEVSATIAEKQEDETRANRIESNKAIKDAMDVAYEKKLPENLDLLKTDAENKGSWSNELEADYLRLKNNLKEEQLAEEKRKQAEGKQKISQYRELMSKQAETLQKENNLERLKSMESSELEKGTNADPLLVANIRDNIVQVKVARTNTFFDFREKAKNEDLSIIEIEEAVAKNLISPSQAQGLADSIVETPDVEDLITDARSKNKAYASLHSSLNTQLANLIKGNTRNQIKESQAEKIAANIETMDVNLTAKLELYTTLSLLGTQNDVIKQLKSGIPKQYSTTVNKYLNSVFMPLDKLSEADYNSGKLLDVMSSVREHISEFAKTANEAQEKGGLTQDQIDDFRSKGFDLSEELWTSAVRNQLSQ